MSSSKTGLSVQEKHFADQIDGLLERVNLLEKFLGGRWHVADVARVTPETSAPHVDDFIARITSDLRGLTVLWKDIDVDIRNSIVNSWRVLIIQRPAQETSAGNHAASCGVHDGLTCSCRLGATQKASEPQPECCGCKDGWQLSKGWHWDSIGHMHRCTAENAGE